MNKRKLADRISHMHIPLLSAFFDRTYKGSFTEFIDDWKWILSFSKKHYGIIIVYTILGIGASSLSIISAYISRVLINIIVDKQYQNLWILVTTMILSTLSSLVFESIMSRQLLRMTINVKNDIQSSIFDQIIDSKWDELKEYSNGDILNRFNSDISSISGNAIGWIPGLIINIYTFICTFVVMLRLDVAMAFIAFASAPFLLFISRFVLKKLSEYQRRILKLNSSMMSFEVDTFNNFDTIKSFGVTGHYSKKLREWQKKYKQFSLEYNTFEIKTKIIYTLISTAVAMTAFFYCLYRLWTGKILYGDMTFFLSQRSSLSGNFSTLIRTIPNMINSAVSAHRVRELTELENEIHDPESLEKLKATAEKGLTVSLNEVSFSYKGSSKVYEKCDFVARPGEIVAVLGESGGGKTTLLRLLLGLIRPEEGRVTLRDDDGVEFDINADLRLLFSYVPQGQSLFSGTIAENMRIAKEDATDEEIINALKAACAYDFVDKMDGKINAPIGESGKGLSTGQAQRIAIARAILRDAPVIMFDEATSALDMKTEEEVIKNIVNSNSKKTYIISTHRTSVLKKCTRIYSVKDNSICEISKEDIDSYTNTNSYSTVNEKI